MVFDDEPFRSNDPEILDMIAESDEGIQKFEKWTFEHFVFMLDQARRLARAKNDLAMSPEMYVAFATRLRISKTDSGEIWKLDAWIDSDQDRSREFAIGWANAKINKARDKHESVPVISWRAYHAQYVKPKPQAAAPAESQEEESQADELFQSQLDNLKSALEIAQQTVREMRMAKEQAERERDEALAEVARLRRELELRSQPDPIDVTAGSTDGSSAEPDEPDDSFGADHPAEAKSELAKQTLDALTCLRDDPSRFASRRGVGGRTKAKLQQLGLIVKQGTEWQLTVTGQEALKTEVGKKASSPL